MEDNFKWMGNYLHKSFSLSDREEKTLLECARWLQEEGYFHPKGYLCGVDFFRTETDLCLSEMNTRWTGGHIPARLVDKLAMGSADVYFIADRFSPDKLKMFQTFVDNNLYHPGAKVSDFKVLPLGIVPLYTDDDGSKISKVLMMVIGNIHAYTEAKNCVFGEGDLPRANIIIAKMS